MAENNTGTFPVVTNIKISDICGLWEVIRICDGDNKALYPWLGERFKYNFLPEMIYLCLKYGDCHHGTWELTENTFETKKRFSIILNGTLEYRIIDIDMDELILSAKGCEYLLNMRL